MIALHEATTTLTSTAPFAAQERSSIALHDGIW